MAAVARDNSPCGSPTKKGKLSCFFRPKSSKKKIVARSSPKREQRAPQGRKKSEATKKLLQKKQANVVTSQDTFKPDPFVESPLVAGLKKDGFETFLEGKDAVMVMFYEPCCPLSAWSRKHLRAAAMKTKRENHAYAAVDCSKESSLCDREDVGKIPTFKIYSRGNVVGKFEDSKNFGCESMRQHVENTPVMAF